MGDFTRDGSMRDWLLKAQNYTKMPSQFRPYHPIWKFDRKRDTKALEQWIKNLRELADVLESKLIIKEKDQ